MHSLSVILGLFQSYESHILWGGVKIENRENWGQGPNGGGGGVKNPEMSQFQFGNFENRRGGLYFSKISELTIALRHHQK